MALLAYPKFKLSVPSVSDPIIPIGPMGVVGGLGKLGLVVGGGIGGLLVGSLFGGKQELKQAADLTTTQQPIITPTQDVMTTKRMDLIQKLISHQQQLITARTTVSPEVTIEAGRDVTYSPITHIIPQLRGGQTVAATQTPTQIDFIPQITLTPMISLQGAEQKQEAKQDQSGMILLLAAAAVAAFIFLRGKKKK